MDVLASHKEFSEGTLIVFSFGFFLTLHISFLISRPQGFRICYKTVRIMNFYMWWLRLESEPIWYQNVKGNWILESQHVEFSGTCNKEEALLNSICNLIHRLVTTACLSLKHVYQMELFKEESSRPLLIRISCIEMLINEITWFIRDTFWKNSVPHSPAFAKLDWTLIPCSVGDGIGKDWTFLFIENRHG